ncbi:hypothetical protein [Guggenheimella bovis]
MNIALIGTGCDASLRLAKDLHHKGETLHFFRKDVPAAIVDIEGTEYRQRPLSELLTESIDLAYFFDKEDYREIILDLEDKNVLSVDLSGSFEKERTVMRFLFQKELSDEVHILKVAHPYALVISHLLNEIDEVFNLRHARSMIIQEASERPNSVDYTDLEDQVIGHVLACLKNEQIRFGLLTDSFTRLLEERFLIQLDFLRPFNLEGIWDILKGIAFMGPGRPIQVVRIARDLSVDSGLTVLLEGHPEHVLYLNLLQIYNLKKEKIDS